MPGIAGIIGKGSPEENRVGLRLMLQSMRHEPFHISGTYEDARLGAWVGGVWFEDAWPNGLPIWNETRDLGLVLAGELLADPGALPGLPSSDGADVSACARSFLRHYDKAGKSSLERLQGWFSGLLLDLRRQQVLLFNDRYGLGRVYYHEEADRIVFASEAKSILRAFPDARRLDEEGLAQSFSIGCTVRDRTLFAGVSLLPGAAAWTFTPARPVRKEVYFKRSSWENLPTLDELTYYQRLKETFACALPKYLQGPRRVAMSLTGGLDGRLIMTAADLPGGGLPCYTFGGMYRDCTDVKLARRIASACHQPHQVIPVGKSYLQQFLPLAQEAVYVSDGTMDVSGSVEVYVNRLARAIAPVRLTGNYGSEVLRSNVAFAPRMWQPGILSADFRNRVRSAGKLYQEELAVPDAAFIAFKQVPWHHYSRLSVEQSQLTLRSPYLDHGLVALSFQAPRKISSSSQPMLQLIAERNRLLSRIPTDHGLLYRRQPCVSLIRRLCREFSIKAENAFDGNMPQWLARVDHATSFLGLERWFVGRNRFYHFRIWYRDQLAECVREVLLDPRSRQRSYLEPGSLETIVDRHTRGTHNYTFEIQKLLSIELFQRLLLERNWN